VLRGQVILPGDAAPSFKSKIPFRALDTDGLPPGFHTWLKLIQRPHSTRVSLRFKKHKMPGSRPPLRANSARKAPLLHSGTAGGPSSHRAAPLPSQRTHTTETTAAEKAKTVNFQGKGQRDALSQGLSDRWRRRRTGRAPPSSPTPTGRAQHAGRSLRHLSLCPLRATVPAAEGTEAQGRGRAAAPEPHRLRFLRSLLLRKRYSPTGRRQTQRFTYTLTSPFEKTSCGSAKISLTSESRRAAPRPFGTGGCCCNRRRFGDEALCKPTAHTPQRRLIHPTPYSHKHIQPSVLFCHTSPPLTSTNSDP